MIDGRYTYAFGWERGISYNTGDGSVWTREKGYVMKDQPKRDKWQKAEDIYKRKIECIEANMDRRDISCSHYQFMRVASIKEAGLGDHSHMCVYGKCSDDCPQHAK